MTNLEAKVLNVIENGYNHMKVFNLGWTERELHNGFSLLLEKDQISLIDNGIVVVVFNRGYVQLTQIIPLVCDIVAIYGEDEK